jgi:hypothetical protein
VKLPAFQSDYLLQNQHCTKVHIDGTNGQLPAQRTLCKLALLVNQVQMTTPRGAAMNTTIRATIFLSIMSFAGLTMASVPGDRVNLADFATHPEALAGRTLEVTANVIAINADGRSLEMFDSKSRTRIAVRLTQLPKSQRMALICSDVRRLMVSGRASVVAGRLTIDAESVQSMPLLEEARVQDSAPRPAAQVEVVPIVVANN